VPLLLTLRLTNSYCLSSVSLVRFLMSLQTPNKTHNHAALHPAYTFTNPSKQA